MTVKCTFVTYKKHPSVTIVFSNFAANCFAANE